MRICLIPLVTKLRDPETNKKEIEKRFDEIDVFKPDLVCFPECTLTGYLCDDDEIKQFAEPVAGNTSAFFSQMAKKNGCYVCYGFLESAPEGVYNSAVMMNKTGEIIFIHRKMTEYPPFINGNVVEAVETELGQISVIICSDLFSEKVQKAIDPSVDLLIIPMARCFDGKSPDMKRWIDEERQAYLDETAKFGVMCCIINAFGIEGDEAYFGGALITGQNGELLAESLHGADHVLIYDV